jgi:hypothetical protein
MSQRNSGFTRVPHDDYPTPPGPVKALAPYLRTRVLYPWDPAAGKGYLVNALKDEGFRAFGTTDDFLLRTKPPSDAIQAIVMNSPWGIKGRTAEQFIKHALSMSQISLIAALLPIDFDSAITRPDLFRDCKFFAGKIVLLGRIKWFPGPSDPSTNNCWGIWSRSHSGLPTIRYARCLKDQGVAL